MRVLVVGASGFIGSRIVAGLLTAGHRVVCAGRGHASLQRRFPACAAIHADLAADGAAEWLPRLRDVDAVVNAAGLLRGDLDRVQHRGAVALFDACATAEVRRVVQISALGAGVQPGSRFLATKAAADAHLLRQVPERSWVVVRPSLVIGRGGDSTALFCALAALPRPVRLGPGTWPVQPLHVADLARIIADLVAAPTVPPLLDLVGPEPMTTDRLTSTLRAWLGLPEARPVTLPCVALEVGARIGGLVPGASLTRESLAMLAAGNTADPAPLGAALGWVPRRLAEALAAEPAARGDRLLARLLPLRPLLLGALLAVWVGSGLASFFVPPQRAAALLAGFALPVALGLALLPPPWRRMVLTAQLLVMAAYTVLASWALPGLWADPFGPLLKNLAVLATTLALLAIEG